MSARRYLAIFFSTACLLLAGVIGLTVWVDPFGQLRSQSPYDRSPAMLLNRSLFKIAGFERYLKEHGEDPHLSVILGDSTADQLDARVLGQRTGRPWYNLAYGGATLPELLVLLDRLLREHELSTVYVNLPFRRVVVERANDVQRSLDIARRPWLHFLSYEALQAAVYVLRVNLLGTQMQGYRPDMEGAALFDYQLERSRVEMEATPWPEAELTRLAELEAAAARRGVRIVYTRMPQPDALNALFAGAFADRFARYRRLMAGRCVIDLNDGDARWPVSWYQDLLHLDDIRRPGLAEAFALRVRDEPCARESRAAQAGAAAE